MSQKKVVELAKLLKVKPEKVIHYLNFPLGKKVVKGDVLAQRKRLLGKKQVTSPIDGILKKLDLDTGNLVIFDEEDKRESDLEKKVKSSGKKSSKPIEKLEIVWGWGEAEGELVIVKHTLCLEDLKTETYQDKIILAEDGIEEPGVIFKAEVLGAAGLVVISDQVDQQVWIDIAEASEIGVVFTQPKSGRQLSQFKGKQVNIKASSGEIHVI